MTDYLYKSMKLITETELGMVTQFINCKKGVSVPRWLFSLKGEGLNLENGGLMGFNGIYIPSGTTAT